MKKYKTDFVSLGREVKENVPHVLISFKENIPDIDTLIFFKYILMHGNVETRSFKF